MFTSPFHHAAVVVDMVVLREAPFKSYEVLVIRRGQEPYKGLLALPGGHVETETELVKDAAVRELQEETGIDVFPHQVHFIGYYDKVDRHPGKRAITFAFCVVVGKDTVVKAGDDATECVWVDADDVLIPELAFDHNQIVADTISRLSVTL